MPTSEEACALIRVRIAEAALGEEIDQDLLDAVCVLLPGIESVPRGAGIVATFSVINGGEEQPAERRSA